MPPKKLPLSAHSADKGKALTDKESEKSLFFILVGGSLDFFLLFWGLGRDIDFVRLNAGLLEIFDGPAKTATDFRQFFRAKQDDNHHKDD